MRIRFLGTANAEPTANRRQSAVLFEGEQRALLVDAGEGVAGGLSRTDCWSQPIGAVLLTHAHPDHVSGLPGLLHSWKLTKRTEPVALYAPKLFLEGLLSWLTAVRLAPERLPFRLHLKQLCPNTFPMPTGHVVQAWRNGHISTKEGGSYSLNISGMGKRWLYSSDLPSLKPLHGHLDNLDGLILEATHIEPGAGVALAKKHGVPQVILTHLPPELPGPPPEGAVWAEDDLVVENT